MWTLFSHSRRGLASSSRRVPIVAALWSVAVVLARVWVRTGTWERACVRVPPVFWHGGGDGEPLARAAVTHRGLKRDEQHLCAWEMGNVTRGRALRQRCWQCGGIRTGRRQRRLLRGEAPPRAAGVRGACLRGGVGGVACVVRVVEAPGRVLAEELQHGRAPHAPRHVLHHHAAAPWCGSARGAGRAVSLCQDQGRANAPRAACPTSRGGWSRVAQARAGQAQGSRPKPLPGPHMFSCHRQPAMRGAAGGGGLLVACRA